MAKHKSFQNLAGAKTCDEIKMLKRGAEQTELCAAKRHQQPFWQADTLTMCLGQTVIPSFSHFDPITGSGMAFQPHVKSFRPPFELLISKQIEIYFYCRFGHILGPHLNIYNKQILLHNKPCKIIKGIRG